MFHNDESLAYLRNESLDFPKRHGIVNLAKRLARFEENDVKVKLKDIADAAGVSISTVSRVINGDRERPAGPETTEKIWRIVKELGYVPNQNAKKLVKGEEEDNPGKGRIGCLYTSTGDIKTDPFFSCIGIGIQQEIRRLSYDMAYALPTYAMDYSDVYNYITSHPVEGIVVTGRFEKDILDLLQKNFKHIVYAGVNAVNAGFDEVVCNGYEGAAMAIRHLQSMGHKDIGYVGYIHDQAEDVQLVNEHRYSAYCDLVGISDSGDLRRKVIHTRLYTTSAYEAMSAYLEKVDVTALPTAFYCANDATAFGVMKAIQERGIKIPDDIAIVGLDDVEMSRFVTPSLSTVSIPRKSLGIQAVKMLVDQIESKRDYPLRMDLPFNLKIRESSDYIAKVK